VYPWLLGWLFERFACFALWYVGKNSISDSLLGDANIVKIEQAKPFNEANLRACNLQIGDIVCCQHLEDTWHSAMFLGYEENGLKVLDCNWDLKCGVSIHVWSYTYSRYAGLNFAATRLANYQPDASVPEISNIRVKDADSTGFTVTCTVTDDEGVGAVYFPVWTEANGQDDLASIWPTGTAEGNNVYSYRVNVADHNNEYGVYVIHVYARDTYGAQAEPSIATYDNTMNNPNRDTTPPSITNVVVTDLDATGYTVTATATDDVGISMIRFPTRRADQGDTDWIWYDGSLNEDGSYSKRVSISEFDNVGGTYYTHIYAYDAVGNTASVWSVEPYVDTIPPVISDAKITSVDGGGYTVECTVTDNIGVDRVQFPTWTEHNNQDDLLSDWNENPTASGTANGNVYTFRVKDIDHNFERGLYTTHIYAFDTAGNYIIKGLTCDLQNQSVAVVEETHDGHTYQFIDDRMTWYEAKEACEALGGHLVTITSAEEQQAIESMLPTESTSYGYFIGGLTENSVSKWVTGENFDYTNWYSGEPNGGNETTVEDVYQIYSRFYSDEFVGKWNDVASDASGMGYICEFEPIEITAITLSESETEVGFGQTKTLEATVTPEGYHPPITWISANPSIATVSDGVITGVAAGTTTITAECGGKTATCKVTVVKPFESITLNLADKTLFKNETCTLEVSFTPADANASKELLWTSANPQVATVDENGVVTAVGTGSTTITAALKQNPQVSATCTVQVTSYVVTFDTKGGSSIAPQEYGRDNILEVEAPTKSGYAFTGWYKDAECTISWDMENDVVNGNITLYAGWMEYHEGLWIVEIPAQKYTGSAIKPQVEVYHYATKLTEGTDYKVSYKNNKNAGDKSSVKAPTVTVSGKGNYTGKETATFTISPKNLADAEVEADNVSLATNGKVQKPIPVVSWKGKKLKKDKDFTVEYPDTGAGAYQNDGVYAVRIVGKGNFHGERTVQFYLTGGNVMSKAKVSSIPAQTYTGKEITPEVTVKYGSAVLTKDVDYTVSYRNNVVAGTATMILKGMGSYSGEKKVTFKIKGTPLSQTEVTLMPESVAYTGKAIAVPYELKLKDNSSVILREGYDYTATYKNNTNVGTATITFEGINGYSGSIKKTFRITGYDIKADSAKAVTVKYSPSIGYMKGGTTMEPKVTCFGKNLKKNVDYKLTYKNNKEVYDGSDTAKMPTVIISGKGNYSGSLELNFYITTQDISLLNMTAPDKVYQSKAGKCLSIPIIKDVNGKKLAAGKDYEKNAVYTYTTDTKLADGTIRSAGSVIQASDILPAGTSVTVTAKGMGNYTSEISCTYRIVQADITKAKGKIAAQIYTGKAIEPGKSDITLTVGKTTLAPTDYEIVSYSNNVKKGTATVVVKGVGNYGGTREIKFKIKSKVFSWWWR